MTETKQGRGGLETIDIRGKAYVTVAERIKSVTDVENLDNNKYEIERWERFELEGRNFLTCHIIVGTDEAEVPTHRKRYSGTSQISFTGGMVNTTSGYENAETSALGRALGMAGIGLLEGVASADEIHKATAAKSNDYKAPEEPSRQKNDEPISNLSREKLKQAIVDSKRFTGPSASTDVKAFYYDTIGKEAPTTEADAGKLIKTLEVPF